jgi:hypothetical protein
MYAGISLDGIENAIHNTFPKLMYIAILNIIFTVYGTP